ARNQGLRQRSRGAGTGSSINLPLGETPGKGRRTRPRSCERSRALLPTRNSRHAAGLVRMPAALAPLAPIRRSVRHGRLTCALASPSADESSPSTPFDDLLRRFFENRGNPNPGSNPGREVVALGSGFIIDPSGYVVTNNHVVGNSEKITVMFQDNSRHQAKIVGR